MELRVYLKVCEVCGCLWYRTQTETRVYCSTCYEKLKEFPTPQSRKRRGRPRKVNLPTVFAVAAQFDFPDRFNSAEHIVGQGHTSVSHRNSSGFERTLLAGLGFSSDSTSRHKRIVSTGALAPEGMPAAIMAQNAGALTSLAGGAQ